MYDQTNIFKQILDGKIPCDKVYEDNEVLAFKDIAPAAPIHILVIPKGEYTDFSDFLQKAGNEAVARYFNSLEQVVKSLNLKDGYRLITNKGLHGSQTVPHFHTHILSGRELGGLLPR